VVNVKGSLALGNARNYADARHLQWFFVHFFFSVIIHIDITTGPSAIGSEMIVFSPLKMILSGGASMANVAFSFMVVPSMVEQAASPTSDRPVR